MTKPNNTTFYATNSIKQRFERSIIKTNDNSCWLWSGNKRRGYGRFWINYETIPAHRASYVIYVGAIREDLLILHKCHNRACVNPEHLKTGTHQENMKDMTDTDRQAKGEKHGTKTHPESLPHGEAHHRTYLAENQVRHIRSLASQGMKFNHIAKLLGIDRGTVRGIVLRIYWRHLP